MNATTARHHAAWLPLCVLLAICSFLLVGAAHAADIEPAFPDLPAFDSPINIEHPGDGTDRLFVVERAGRIYVIDNDEGVSTRSLFLDISSKLTTEGECGLLGLAFHPNYESNRYFYVFYVDGSPLRSVVARFTANAVNPSVADSTSQFLVLTFSQNGFYHKGGCLEFGPDGYLYISMGEDGVGSNAQLMTTLKGKLLRINVDQTSGGLNYSIPPDNPFANNVTGIRKEIWAWGFRNPWRFSIDFDTGQLWLGDVGQDSWEEVDRIKKGRNYGWSRMEGNVCYPIGQPCDTTGLNVDLPLAVYNHTQGSASITGGNVYRGPAVPSLYGKYVFADFILGEIWWLDPENNPAALHLIDDTLLNVSAFGADDVGELYFSAFNGTIYKFVESATDVPTRAPSVGALRAVHPNPFQTSASIDYTMERDAVATLEVFDVRGKRVATLLEKAVPAGDHTAVWDGRDVDGRTQPSGVYFCRLTVDGTSVGTQRIVLVR